jgi:lysozyme family protein
MPKKSPTYNELRDEYRRLWSATLFTDKFVEPSTRTARKILSAKARYQQIERALGVPWYVVGCIHAMESGCKFSCHLHNGDSLRARTWRVPKGRPLTGRAPFSWTDSAVDALTMKGWQNISSWPVERILYECERYNGWGYRLYHREVLTKYLWSGTHWGLRPGKYVSDGTWGANAHSDQSGVVVLLHRLAEMDSSIQFHFDEPLAPDDAPAPVPNPNRMPEVVPVSPPEPEVIVADADITPETYAKAEEDRVAKAMVESRTITGSMVAGVGVMAGYFDATMQTLTDAATEVATWGPATNLLNQLGANVRGIGFSLAVGGLTLVVARRLNAARQGKEG